MGEARDSDQVWQITGIEREELANGGGGRMGGPRQYQDRVK